VGPRHATRHVHDHLPLLTASPGKRCVILGEGTHTMLMERNRGALYQAVQVFLEEGAG
jgi:hypothetical protein